MKTLQVVGNARFGGATLLMLEWSKFLVAKGCDVHVLCTDERMKKEAQAIVGVAVIDDIYVPKEIEAQADLRALRRIYRLCRREAYDVVHTYTATPSFLGRVAASVARVPVVVNHQGGWAVNEMSSTIDRLIFTPLEYVATLACTRNICVSHSERTKAIDLHLAPDRKLVTIVNGIDAEPFKVSADRRNAQRSALNCGPETVLIGNTGRLVPGKGNASAISALALLLELVPQLSVRLVLAGDGEERSRLEELIAKESLENHVDLLGFVDDIPGFLSALDIFVTPTLTEGLSVSILEAMASATAVIATSIPANAEVVEDGISGLLVPPNDVESLAKSLQRLVVDEVERKSLGEAGRRRVEQVYSMERMFDETWELYTRLRR